MLLPHMPSACHSCWYPTISNLTRYDPQADPMLRRDVQRSLQEAEQLALKTLEQVIKQPTLQLPPRGGFLREKKDRE